LNHPKDEIINIHPAYNSIMVSLSNSAQLDQITRYLKNALSEYDIETERKTRTIEIPLVYGGEYGPDLKRIANYSGKSESEVINIHSEAIYIVNFIGFSIGFPYCSGMNESISTPRLETPRKLVDAGSVGIAGNQTGIYPLSSPGGWNLIGKTPKTIFDTNNPESSYLQMGDQLRFVSIAEEEFQRAST